MGLLSQFFGGGGGSGSSSSSSTSTTQVDRRQDVGAGATGVSGDVGGDLTLVQTDQGAIAGAFAVATQALQGAEKGLHDLTAGQEANAQAGLQGARALLDATTSQAETSDQARLQGFRSLLDSGDSALARSAAEFHDVIDLQKDSSTLAYDNIAQQTGLLGDITRQAAASVNTSGATLDLLKYIALGVLALGAVFVLKGGA